MFRCNLVKLFRQFIGKFIMQVKVQRGALREINHIRFICPLVD